MSNRKPPLLDALGKCQGLRRWTDRNLQDLHDLALITLVRSQHELQRRGVSGTDLVQRSQSLALFSTDPGKPPLCECILAAFDADRP